MSRKRWWYMRNSNCWKSFRKYFPLKLVKTAELDPRKNYIFCVFPHGLMSIGPTTFVNDVLGYNELFPGITAYTCVAFSVFLLPGTRDLMRSLGVTGIFETHLSSILSRPNGGNAAVLVVGGREEVALSYPKTYKIFLKKRKGFIRLALKHGASLVPVIQFGVNDLFIPAEIPNNCFIQFLFKIYKIFFYGLPIIPLGRFGVIPYPKPVTVVVGSPLEVEHVPCPSKEKIEEVHAEFEKRLIQLFENEKHII